VALKALIMAGGQGTRFWPLSRELYPKQLLKLGGRSTLLQQTVERLHGLIPPDDVYVVTGPKLVVDIKTQLGQLDANNRIPAGNVIVEPAPRNTAPAIGLGALRLMRQDPGSVMAVLPSDHMIKETTAFHGVLKSAQRLAETGRLVVFGIRPTRPETGYGYIRLGREIDKGAYEVDSFVEKPDRATAEGYLASGDYLWNSGMFVWKASAILEEIKKHMPALHAALMRIDEAADTSDEASVLEEVFKDIEPQSIDFGVMEKAEGVAAVIAGFTWSDLGSWDAIQAISEPDADGNVIAGRVVQLDCQDTTIYADERLVAGIGLRDMVVVDTADATLVCRKDMAQRVKDVVGILKERGYGEYSTHKTVQRPWGSYTVLQEGPMYKIKRIEVRPGARLSMQMHHHRSEHWVVVSGTARVTNGERVYNVHVNESTYIPISTMHRLENPGKVTLEIIEVQNGQYLDEDDIVRMEDDFERV
jgi:mannose-1-phosphate guanylyltransferase/mannose-6-phosphate isomerase